MIRAMSRDAEAQRVEACAEHEASLKLVQAGQQYTTAPLSLRLREIQNYTQIATEKIIIIIIPSSLDHGITRALETLSRRLNSCDERGFRGNGDDREVEKRR